MGNLEIEPSEPPSHLAADGGGRRQQIRAKLRDVRATTPRRVQVAGGALVVVVLLVGVVLMAGRSGSDAEDAARLETVDGEGDQGHRDGSRDERSGERRRGAILDIDEETLQRYGYGPSRGGRPSAGGGPVERGPQGPVEWDGSGLDLRAHFRQNPLRLPGLSLEMPADLTPPTEAPGPTGDTTTTTTTSTPSTTTTTVAPAAADLSVALADWTRAEDGRFSVAIRVTNLGPQRAEELELEVTLPADAALGEGWRPSGGWACAPPAGRTLRCTRDHLDAGSPAELKVDGTGAPTSGSASATVSATVSARTADPDAQNNTATHTWRGASA